VITRGTFAIGCQREIKPGYHATELQQKEIVMNEPSTEVQIKTTNDRFGHFATLASGYLGSKWAFAGAGLVIVVWASVGPIFHFSDTWQLVINTGTTIVTFLMVFLIQNTQNRDARAINLKLNELIRAIDKARDQMIDIENLSDLELDDLQATYEKIKAECDERQSISRSQTNQDVND
jgi:low affinity Fe/Cu permease